MAKVTQVFIGVGIRCALTPTSRRRTLPAVYISVKHFFSATILPRRNGLPRLCIQSNSHPAMFLTKVTPLLFLALAAFGQTPQWVEGFERIEVNQNPNGAVSSRDFRGVTRG